MSDRLPELIQKLTETGLASRPGKLLYSGLLTLRPGSVYLLGYNPGGEPDHETAPILAHIRSETSATRNEYLDAAWETRTYSYPAGMAPLQRRVVYLLTGLGFDVRSVCASNLIFVRSKSAQHLETPLQLAAQCWPVHQLILDIVQPDCIVSFDKKVWDFIHTRARMLPSASVESIASGHGNWTCLFARITLDGRQVSLISLPHLSRYAIDHHPEVVKWVRTKLAATR
jgi:hypothetical protein